MSYNVDSSEYISGKLSIKRKDLYELYAKYVRSICEICFLQELNPVGDLNEILPINEKDICYGGEGSGRFYADYLTCLEKTIGEAKILFTWEGGDSRSAIYVKNGIVQEKRIKIVIDD